MMMINHVQNVMRIARPAPEVVLLTNVILAQMMLNVPMVCIVAHTITCVCSMEPIVQLMESLSFPK